MSKKSKIRKNRRSGSKRSAVHKRSPRSVRKSSRSKRTKHKSKRSARKRSKRSARKRSKRSARKRSKRSARKRSKRSGQKSNIMKLTRKRSVVRSSRNNRHASALNRLRNDHRRSRNIGKKKYKRNSYTKNINRKYRMVNSPTINDRVARLYPVSNKKNTKYEFFHGTIINLTDMIQVHFDDNTIYHFKYSDDQLINIPKLNEVIKVLWEDHNGEFQYHTGKVNKIYNNAYKIKYEDGQEHTHEFTERTWTNMSNEIKFDASSIVGDLLLQRAQATDWLEAKKDAKQDKLLRLHEQSIDDHTKMINSRSPKKKLLSRMYKEQHRPKEYMSQALDIKELDVDQNPIQINDGFEKRGQTVEYEYRWLDNIARNFEKINTQISNQDIYDKMNSVMSKLDTSIQTKIQELLNISSLPERIYPFVQVLGYNHDENLLLLEKVGTTENQVRNWLNNKTNEQRKQSSVRLLFYLSYALLIIEKLGEKHNDLTNPDNVHILGDPDNLYIKIFDPKEEDIYDTKPDIDGIVNIIQLTFQDGSLRKPPEHKPRKSKSRRSLDEDDDGMGMSRSRLSLDDDGMGMSRSRFSLDDDGSGMGSGMGSGSKTTSRSLF